MTVRFAHLRPADWWSRRWGRTPPLSAFGTGWSSDRGGIGRRGRRGTCTGLGVLYAARTAVASADGTTPRCWDRLGVRGVFSSSLTRRPPGFCGSRWTDSRGHVVRTAKPLVQPIVNGYINDHVESVGRATLLSAVPSD
ncbi:hypothetical protein C9J85_09720 [Haloferax sp. wsp5]|nr:hypothetical protein C9J85_09720 [Haloferax sp. wsp5]